jgi:hypothetical protein
MTTRATDDLVDVKSASLTDSPWQQRLASHTVSKRCLALADEHTCSSMRERASQHRTTDATTYDRDIEVCLLSRHSHSTWI